MSGDGLGFSGLADHEQLREDGHGLQIDGERPQDLEMRIRMDKLEANLRGNECRYGFALSPPKERSHG